MTRVVFFRSLRTAVHLFLLKLYYRAYIGCAFFFCLITSVCVQHAHPLKRKFKRRRRRNLFFFGSWSQPTLLQLLALHFHGRLDRINRPLYARWPLSSAAGRPSFVPCATERKQQTSVALAVHRSINAAAAAVLLCI